MWLREWVFAWMRDLAMSRAPDFIVGKPGSAYLLRWFVLPRNPVFNVYLHCFLRSDDDRALHDHPWVNASWLLNGSYTEHMIAQGGVPSAVVRATGDWVFRRSGRLAHRVELHAGPCWTLFVTGPRYREWGFHCANGVGWRSWKVFTSSADRGQIGKGCDP